MKNPNIKSLIFLLFAASMTAGRLYISHDSQKAFFYFDESKVPEKQRSRALLVAGEKICVNRRSRRQSFCAVVQRSKVTNTRRVFGVFPTMAAALRYVRRSTLSLPSQCDASDEWQTAIVRCTNCSFCQPTAAVQCKKRKYAKEETFWCQRDLDRRFTDFYCTTGGGNYFSRVQLADGRVVRMSSHYKMQYN